MNWSRPSIPGAGGALIILARVCFKLLDIHRPTGAFGTVVVDERGTAANRTVIKTWLIDSDSDRKSCEI